MQVTVIPMSQGLFCYLATLAPDAGETGNHFFEQLPEVVSQQSTGNVL